MRFTMRRILCCVAQLLLACAGLPAASAHDGDHSMSMAPGQIMVHSADYRVPDVWQVRDDGKRVRQPARAAQGHRGSRLRATPTPNSRNA